ncbi:MAG TPA: DinB family protein [Gemmatimonadaceae bacterium]
MKRIAVSLAAMLVAAPVFAQSPGVDAAKANWQGMSNYITRAAEQMSEADYAYKPVAGVRSFGQLIGHIAGSQYMFCAIVLGEPARGEDDIEKTKTTKADLVAAMKASNDYCAKAYAMNDGQAAGMIKLFGQDRSRMHALVMNGVHLGEHYGNIVTYMRMKNMVPPSSQPSGQ